MFEHTEAGRMSQSSNPYLALDNLREMNRMATTTMGGNEKMQEMAMASPLEYGMMTATQAQSLAWKRQEMFKLPGRNRRSEGYAMQLSSKRKQVRSRKVHWAYLAYMQKAPGWDNESIEEKSDE